jgi:tRNA 2-thiouridine synthesizing protein D
LVQGLTRAAGTPLLHNERAMTFGILVNEGPYQHEACDSALNFALAVIARGHTLVRVFFYHDGVNVATRLAAPPQDDRDLLAAWQALARDHCVDLVVCVAAAERRGVLDEAQSARHGLEGHNLAPGFRIAGLGQLVEVAVDADRFVVFG